MKKTIMIGVTVALLLSIALSGVAYIVFRFGIEDIFDKMLEGTSSLDFEKDGVSYFCKSVMNGYQIEKIDDSNNPSEMDRIVIPDYINDIEVSGAGVGCYVCTPVLRISCTHTERIYFPWTLGVFSEIIFGPENSDVLKYVISSSNANPSMGWDTTGDLVEIRNNEEGKYVITNWLWKKKQRDKPSIAKTYYEYFLPANISYMFNYDDNPNEGYFFVDLLEESGKLMKPPYDPRREGYAFLGWYKDEGCTEAWDFENDEVEIHFDEEGNRIYEEIKLYAKWYKRW